MSTGLLLGRPVRLPVSRVSGRFRWSLYGRYGRRRLKIAVGTWGRGRRFGSLPLSLSFPRDFYLAPTVPRSFLFLYYGDDQTHITQDDRIRPGYNSPVHGSRDRGKVGDECSDTYVVNVLINVYGPLGYDSTVVVLVVPMT